MLYFEQVCVEEKHDADDVERPEPVLRIPLQRGIDAHERKRIQEENLQVEAHGGVLRENHGREDESAHAQNQHQQRVEPPKPPFFQEKFGNDDCEDDELQQATRQRKKSSPNT